jgi:hypothetical protein
MVLIKAITGGGTIDGVYYLQFFFRQKNPFSPVYTFSLSAVYSLTPGGAFLPSPLLV